MNRRRFGLPSFPAGGGARRQRRAGLTATEILVVIGLAVLCLGAIYRVFSHYSRSFLKIDHRIENLSEAWLTVRALTDDLMMADVPEGDVTRWREVIRVTDRGVVIRRRSQGRVVEVVYEADAQTRSLTRVVEGGQFPLIRQRCRRFICQPTFGEMVGSVPRQLTVALHLEIETASPPAGIPAPPLVLETSVSPDFLNLRLQGRYQHQGLPR